MMQNKKLSRFLNLDYMFTMRFLAIFIIVLIANVSASYGQKLIVVGSSDGGNQRHQFLSFNGLSINMCESQILQKISEMGFVQKKKQGPNRQGLTDYYYKNPSDKFSVGQIYAQKSDLGKLELTRLRIVVSRSSVAINVGEEVSRIESLYGRKKSVCREISGGFRCQGRRDVGPYNLSLGASFDSRVVTFEVRARFLTGKALVESPKCLGDAGQGAGGGAAIKKAPPISVPPSGNPSVDGQTAKIPPDGMPPSGAPSIDNPTNKNPPSDKQARRPAPVGKPTDNNPPLSEQSKKKDPAESQSSRKSPGGKPPVESQPEKKSETNPGQSDFEAGQKKEKQASSETDPSKVARLHKEAVEHYKRAAEQGHPEAQFNLSRKYANGEGVKKSHSEEIKYLQAAANQGLSIAQYNLAVKYATGTGQSQDQEKATEYFERAARNGNADAQLELAKRKLAGLGTEQSDSEAIKWLEQAAENGSLEAQYLLARILEEGVLAKQDRKRAERYYRQSAANGYKPALDRYKSANQSPFPPNDIGQIRPDAKVRY